MTQIEYTLGHIERFWSNVNQHGAVSDHRPDLGPCWEWTGKRSPKGYGGFSIKVDGRQRQYPAHRIALDLSRITLIKGLVVDHLCRVRHCVRPSHMEQVTHRENILRGVGLTAQNAAKTHCKHGHQNWGLDRHGTNWRRCLTCRAIGQRRMLEIKRLTKKSA